MPPILGKLAAQRYARDRERAPAAPAERDATVLPDATVAPEAADHAPEQGDAAVPGFLPPDAPGAPVTELRLPTSPRTPDNAR